jgi:hypothetical protein
MRAEPTAEMLLAFLVTPGDSKPKNGEEVPKFSTHKVLDRPLADFDSRVQVLQIINTVRSGGGASSPRKTDAPQQGETPCQ